MADRNDMIPAATLADLARAGYLMSRQSFMQVTFEVHHIRDRGGYLHTLLARTLDEPSGRRALGTTDEDPVTTDNYQPRETLSSGANGVGLVIGTYAGGLHPDLQNRRQGSGLPVALKVDNHNGDRVFRGTAWPNPTFIYESAASFEGLISIDDASTLPTHEHGLAVCEVLHFISGVAKDREAPLLLLHSPVQLPPLRDDEDGIKHRKELWPEPSAVAVRFAIALKDPSTDVRLELADKVIDFCNTHGYSFWLADTRAGYRPGNWFPVKVHGSAGATHAVRNRRSEPVAYCLPVTFVGPARVGSTFAILSYLREFGDIGVVACSISSLDDLAFIHLQLAVHRPVAAHGDDPSRSEPDPRSLRAAFDSAVQTAASKGLDRWTSSPDELLPVILPLLAEGRTTIQDLSRSPVRALLIERAGNYQALAGPPMPVRSGEAGERVALWFSWQTVGSDAGLAAPLVALLDAVAAIDPQAGGDGPAGSDGRPTVDYLICRDMGDQVLRAKGKISVPKRLVPTYGDAPLETPGARLCTSLEDAWRAEIERHDLPGTVELSVAWHEYRLDHATSWL